MSFRAQSSGINSVSSALAVLYNKHERHFLFENRGVIGRSPSAFLCITESYISRTHCVIEKTNEKFTICDMSNSGTYLNDKRLIKNQIYELNHLDQIKLAEMDAHSYVFLINKKHLGIKTPPRVKSGSVLADKMIDLNESHSIEKEKMEKEMDLIGLEMAKLQEELQRLKAQEEKIEGERLKASIESASNKEQADKAEIKLKETMEEKEKAMRDYEHKISDVTKKVEELQQTKNEMEKRHIIEREELENKCKAEIEELRKKLEKSESQHQQFEELQMKLEETKNVLLESELEQQRLFEAKFEVETKLETKIVDLTNDEKCDEPVLAASGRVLQAFASVVGLLIEEKETKAVQLKELEMKLKEKEESEERIQREIEGLEDDMMCSICAELYIEPTALNCGHMFCKLCITEWSKKKKICPMCRAKLVSTVRIYNMDSVIQRNVRLMSEEAQIRREALLEERKKGKTPQKKKSAKKRRYEATLPPAPATELHAGPSNVGPNTQVDQRQPTQRLPLVQIPIGSEGDDPFQAGWVTNLRGIRNSAANTGRYSPVTIAAVDLTNIPMVHIPAPAIARMHTEGNTIDLTDL